MDKTTWLDKAIRQISDEARLSDRQLELHIRERISEDLWNKAHLYQRQAVFQAVRFRGRVLFAHEMSLGKSPISLMTAFYFRQFGPIHVICPTTKCSEWAKDGHDWLEIPKDKIHILYSDEIPQDLGKCGMIIMSYDRARRVAFKLKNAHLFIVDESQKLQNPESKLTATLTPLLKSAVVCMLLSGTPMPNSHKNLYAQLHILRSDVFPNWPSFRNRYCDPQWIPAKGRMPAHMDDSGSSNKEELNRILNQQVMVRKKKTDDDVKHILKLPPISFTLAYIEPTDEEKEIMKNQLMTYDDYVRSKLAPRRGTSKTADILCSLAEQTASKRESKRAPDASRKRPLEPGSDDPSTKRARVESSNPVEKRTTGNESKRAPDKRTAEPGSDDPLAKRARGEHSDEKKEESSGSADDSASAIAKAANECLENAPRDTAVAASGSAGKRAQNMFFQLLAKDVAIKLRGMMTDLVRDMRALPKGEKAIAFGHDGFVLDALCKCAEIAGLDYMRIDGSVPAKKRGAILDKFNKNPKCRIAVESIETGGVGLNQTVASHVYMCQLRYTWDKFEQAVARVHRPGQTRPVDVRVYLLNGSLEERVWWLIRNKLDIASSTIDASTAKFRYQKESI